MGRIGADELGLPRKQARALLLAVAWRRVAGEALAERAPARRVFRGVLEVEASGPRCAEELRRVLPALAGRIAADYPALGVRRCRVIEAGQEGGTSPAADLAPPPPRCAPRPPES